MIAINSDFAVCLQSQLAPAIYSYNKMLLGVSQGPSQALFHVTLLYISHVSNEWALCVQQVLFVLTRLKQQGLFGVSMTLMTPHLRN